MSDKYSFFWNGPFSQWYKSEFKVDNIMYSTAEHYMMAEKARLFNDKEAEAAILKSETPREAKDIGRKVKNFIVGDWNKVARDIVYEGNYHKFTQNEYCLKSLMATGELILVEASPYDTIWGIGHKEDDPLALNESTWKGTNWLGEVLTKLKQDLKAKVKSTSFDWS